MSPGRVFGALALGWVLACGATEPPSLGPAPARPVGAPSPIGAATIDAGAPRAATAVAPVAELGGATPQQTAERMTAAALAADREGYLRFVATDDAHFATEQRNWAKDLERHRPAQLVLELGAVLVDGDVATAPMTLAWRMAGGLPRSVQWPARFVRRATPAGARWLYSGEAWATTEADGVVVRHGAGREATAKAVVSVLPGIRRRVHAEMGFAEGDALAARAQEVKLYASMAHLQASIDLSYTASLSGWNEPGEAIKVLVDGKGVAGDLAASLAHEYAHVATFELGAAATDMPWWALEGVADFVSVETATDSPAAAAASRAALDAKLRARGRAGTLVALDRLADFHGEAQQHLTDVYLEGYGVVAFVTKRHGRAARRAWIEELARGESLATATRVALGMSSEELERAWRASLGAR